MVDSPTDILKTSLQILRFEVGEFLEDLPKERLKKLLVNKYEFRASDPIPKAPLVVMPNFE